ncbi:hypothetical protein HBI24_246270 [Parastagonospora nodorum]|nr:hypothetical protein HBI47_015190 [Parastagonospora nodorum]KAH5563571.1 hypothetical protein HBI24_246270 [Parastagonospora nodorum]KAH5685946.1 hypothetical protein HBI23_046280 [Parastagonospora nodorum]
MRCAAADRNDLPKVHHKWFHGLHLDRCVFTRQYVVQEICSNEACSQRIANVPVGSKRTYL